MIRSAHFFIGYCAFALMLGVFGVLGMHNTAHAADNARNLFMRGQTAYKQGDYEGAIASWQQAYTQDPRPLLKYNIAQAYERLGKLEQAIKELDEYLANAPANDPYQADARAKRAQLGARLQATGIRISGAPDGAKIVIDQKEWGFTPRPDAIQLTPGAHRVELSAKGYRAFTSMVVVPAGESVDVPVQMEALSESELASAEGGEDGENTSSSHGPRRTFKKSVPVLPIVLLGVGGAGLIAGGFLGLRALSKASNALPGTSAAQSAENLALAADIGFGVGIAAMTTGIILWMVDDGDTELVERDTRKQAWHITPTFSTQTAGVSGGFSF